MAGTRVFWTDETGDEDVYLRRWAQTGEGSTCAEGSHRARVFAARLPELLSEEVHATGHRWRVERPWSWFAASQYPSHCERGCGYEFTEVDERQAWGDRIMRASDGREWPLHDLPVGAMYDAWWLPESWKGPDGIGLCVIIPPGDTWQVDMEANNCTRKAVDGVRSHYCWCRHGDPRAGVVHVDKVCDTCAAGAGSIATKRWHGFLHNSTLDVC